MNQPESATIWATMENSIHPEYGVVMIPFPIPREAYDSNMEKLRSMEIGDPLKRDSRVVSILSNYSVLKQLEIMTVNVDELDYLAKRLESFDVGEAAQFQAMAHQFEMTELKDLISLTFCCQKATVITDFSDLEQAGRDHYMNLHGGCAPTKELEQLNGTETARQLLDSGHAYGRPDFPSGTREYRKYYLGISSSFPNAVGASHCPFWHCSRRYTPYLWRQPIPG